MSEINILNWLNILFIYIKSATIWLSGEGNKGYLLLDVRMREKERGCLLIEAFKLHCFTKFFQQKAKWNVWKYVWKRKAKEEAY